MRTMELLSSSNINITSRRERKGVGFVYTLTAQKMSDNSIPLNTPSHIYI
jgi:hypothetical protein